MSAVAPSSSVRPSSAAAPVAPSASAARPSSSAAPVPPSAVVSSSSAPLSPAQAASTSSSPLRASSSLRSVSASASASNGVAVAATGASGSSSSSGLSTAAIGGIVGGVLGTALLVLVAWWMRKRARSSRDRDEYPLPPPRALPSMSAAGRPVTLTEARRLSSFNALSEKGSIRNQAYRSSYYASPSSRPQSTYFVSSPLSDSPPPETNEKQLSEGSPQPSQPSSSAEGLTDFAAPSFPMTDGRDSSTASSSSGSATPPLGPSSPSGPSIPDYAAYRAKRQSMVSMHSVRSVSSMGGNGSMSGRSGAPHNGRLVNLQMPAPLGPNPPPLPAPGASWMSRSGSASEIQGGADSGGRGRNDSRRLSALGGGGVNEDGTRGGRRRSTLEGNSPRSRPTTLVVHERDETV